MNPVDEILNGDEKILWQARPAPLPFFAGAIASFLLGVGGLAILAPLVGGQPTGRYTDIVATLLVLSPFLLVSFLMTVAYPIWRLLTFVRLSYAITNQRIVFQSGVIEHNIATVDLDQIVHADAEVDLTDFFLGFGQTGSVSLATRPEADAEENEGDRVPHVLSHIPHPYDAFRFLHRAEYDVKTDIEFPNRLRPDTNPGYPTTYLHDVP